MIDTACRAGLSRAELLRAGGFEDAGPRLATGTIPLLALFSLWEAVMARLRDPGFPIAVAESFRPETYGVLSLMAMTSEDLGDAFAKMVRFYPLWTHSSQWVLEAGQRQARLTFLQAGELGLGQRCDQEFSLAELTNAIRQVTGAASWTPVEVRFRHPRPTSVSRHERFFGAPLVFGAAQPELVVRPGDLKLPMVRADRLLGSFFEAHAGELLQRVGHLPEDILRAKRAILEELRGRTPRLSEVASRLAVGSRTLRRRLSEEGTTFKALLDEARLELARRYLEESRHSIGEIAYLLGFSEPSAFFRAFKRWTKESPVEFRQRVRGQPVRGR